MIVILGLVACTAATPNNTMPTNEPAVEVVSTDLPTIEEPIAELEGVPTVILVTSPEADPAVAARVKSVLADLASDSQLTLEIEENLTSEMLQQSVQIVVGIGPDLNLANMAGAAPEIAFVVLDDPNTTPGQNVSVIGDPSLERQQQTFMIGYLTALVSRDYKVAALIASDAENSVLMAETFIIGVRFFCGLCRSQFPPTGPYPQTWTLSTEDADEGFRPILDQLVINGIEVLYVDGRLATPELLTALVELNILVVGDSSPDLVRNNWVGTVFVDPGSTLETFWPDLLAGNAGMQIPASVAVDDLDAELISIGRFRLIEELMAELQAGLILTETVP